jgi:hypothetical protein
MGFGVAACMSARVLEWSRKVKVTSLALLPAVSEGRDASNAVPSAQYFVLDATCKLLLYAARGSCRPSRCHHFVPQTQSLIMSKLHAVHLLILLTASFAYWPVHGTPLGRFTFLFQSLRLLSFLFFLSSPLPSQVLLPYIPYSIH